MKQLFRFQPLDIPKEYEYDKIIEEDRKRTDDFLSKYFEIFPIQMTLEDSKLAGISPYFRDNMAEVGNAVIINKNLLPKSADLSNLKLFQKQFIEGLFRGLKKKPIPSNDNSCHAAFYMEAEEFLLVSSKMSMGEQEMSVLGIDKPYYFFHQVSTPFSVGVQAPGQNDFNQEQWFNANGHIDGRVGIIESAKIIYVAPRKKLLVGQEDLYRDANAVELEKIVKEFGYEVREYPYNPQMLKYLKEGPSVLPSKQRESYDKFGEAFTIGPLINGINFITEGDQLFTSYISKDEKKYLASKGVDAIQVPIDLGLNGSGLRCVYGEVNK